MIKADLMNKIAEKLEVSKERADIITHYFIEILKETIENGEEIELRSFGSFRIREQGPRPGRNPKTGEPVQIPARKTVYFKPSRKLKIKR